MQVEPFNQLVREHQSMVFSLALRVVGDRGVAEEVAQDVFMELFRSADKLDGADHTKFWLRRVAVHRATDAVRRRLVRPDVSAADEWLEDGSTAGAPLWHTETPELDSRLDARLEELVTSLPETYRVPLVLRYQEDMTPDEIAALLKQPLATVKSNLRRALEMLRRKAAVTMKEYHR